MRFDDKKFEREIEAVKKHGGFGSSLNEQDRAAVKQRVLTAISQPNAARPLSFREKYHNLIRYIVSIALGLSLVGGTTFDADGTVPGDSLYPIKRIKEKVELSIAVSEEAKAGLRAKFAKKRLEEVHTLSMQFVLNATSTISTTTNATSNASSISASEKHHQLQIQAKHNAGVEVRNALTVLRAARAKLEAKGNTQAAASISNNILNLQSQASDEQVDLEENHDQEVKGEKDDRRQQSPQNNSGQKRGEGGVRVEIRLDDSKEGHD